MRISADFPMTQLCTIIDYLDLDCLEKEHLKLTSLIERNLPIHDNGKFNI